MIEYVLLFLFCRRKPQNLTPPLSSDGGSSSTSGQSPNSQHNGSPPPAVKRPSSQAPSSLNNNINSSNLINDKYLEPAAKKQRISHYKKPDSDGMRSSNVYDGREGNFMNSRTRDNDDYYGLVNLILVVDNKQLIMQSNFQFQHDSKFTRGQRLWAKLFSNGSRFNKQKNRVTYQRWTIEE